MVNEADVLDLLDTFGSSRDWLTRSVYIAEKNKTLSKSGESPIQKWQSSQDELDSIYSILAFLLLIYGRREQTSEIVCWFQ